MKLKYMTTRRRMKWLMLAATAMGTTFQLAACQQDAALFGLRTFMSSFSLPVNQFLQDLLFSLS